MGRRSRRCTWCCAFAVASKLVSHVSVHCPAAVQYFVGRYMYHNFFLASSYGLRLVSQSPQLCRNKLWVCSVSSATAVPTRSSRKCGHIFEMERPSTEVPVHVTTCSTGKK